MKRATPRLFIASRPPGRHQSLLGRAQLQPKAVQLDRRSRLVGRSAPRKDAVDGGFSGLARIPLDLIGRVG
jgi:hypothetical protein